MTLVRNFVHVLLAVLCVVFPIKVCFANSDPCSVSGQRKVLVIGLDGTKGSIFTYAMQSGLAPNFAKLAAMGKSSVCSSNNDSNCATTHSGNRFGSQFPNTREQSDYIWVTSPGWCSVISGVENYKHGVKDNDFPNQSVYFNTSLIYPSFFKRLHTIGLITAATGSPNFMSSPGDGNTGIVDFDNCDGIVDPLATSSCTLDYRLSQDESDDGRDSKATDFGVKHILTECAHVIMVHFDKIDAAGHQYGFENNTGYLAAMTVADALFAKMLSAVQQAVQTRNENWLIVVTSDHGGHQTGHDTVLFEDEIVPFIVTPLGPQSVQLNDLVSPVRHFDVHPTVLAWLGVQPSPLIDGKVQAIPWNGQKSKKSQVQNTLKGKGKGKGKRMH